MYPFMFFKKKLIFVDILFLVTFYAPFARFFVRHHLR